MRVRSSDGKVVTLPEGASAVEFMQDGKIALVVYRTRRGEAAYIEPGSREAARYKECYPDAEFVSVSAVPPPFPTG